MRLIFLSRRNAARSQMAEGFLKHYAGDRFEVHSAGMKPTGLHPLAVQVMAEVGIDISQQESKGTRAYLGRLAVSYAIFVCPEGEATCPAIWPFGGMRLRWPFDDPAAFEGSEAARVEKFRAVRDQIEARIKEWLAKVMPKQA